MPIRLTGRSQETEQLSLVKEAELGVEAAPRPQREYIFPQPQDQIKPIE
jgi:hypothetical protein